MIQDKIRELVQYGLLTGLVSAEDEIYTTNRLLELFRIEDYPYGFGEKIEQTEEEAVKRLPDLLTEMMDYAVENGIMQEDGIVYRDLFDTKIMSCLVGRPVRSSAGFMRNMKSPRKQRRISFINSVRTRTIFEDTVFAGMKSG